MARIALADVYKKEVVFSRVRTLAKAEPAGNKIVLTFENALGLVLKTRGGERVLPWPETTRSTMPRKPKWRGRKSYSPARRCRSRNMCAISGANPAVTVFNEAGCQRPHFGRNSGTISRLNPMKMAQNEVA